MDYKNTLNLPKTEFPMKGNLPKREPLFLSFWEEKKIYEKIQEKLKDKPLKLLHDGPPYANGNIHIGTAMNKILKDMVVKSLTFLGYRSPFIPGWDCHGLPVELAVEKSGKIKKSVSTPAEIISACREYAMNFVNIQRNDFKRLGVLAKWDQPYLTMNYEYEASILRSLHNLFLKDYIFTGVKPIYWCASCETALAEAEVEYEEHISPSIYVSFPIKKLCKNLPNLENAYAIIWTTTPWTLPANLAITVHPYFRYLFFRSNHKWFLVCEELLEKVSKECNLPVEEKTESFKGEELENSIYENTLMKRDGIFILGDFVTLDQGSGLVHTAPGHGMEDYIVGTKYNLDIFAPVDDKGKFTREVPKYEGMNVFESNEIILKDLNELGILLNKTDISHSYPHCWRCKNPIVFRATKQYFVSLNKHNLKEKVKLEIEKTNWIPKWGGERLKKMVENRTDWCISRQRIWGIPIAIFKCKNCGEPLIDKQIFQKVESAFEKKGLGVWFENELDNLPSRKKCKKCGKNLWEKEKNILDVWFDSGVSHIAVLEGKKELSWPCDIYLEGTDQYRGWFQSSLLLAVALKDQAPYRQVITHGFVVDQNYQKMAKSLGNVIHPQEVIQKYGAEILRLWVSMIDYKDDIPISEEILKRVVESYRKLRNTIKYILGNLYDFDKEKPLEFEKLLFIDKYILHKLNLISEKILNGYKTYEFHIVYHTLLQFCSVDLSSFYLDILKDRLYCNKKDDLGRVSAQTALFYIYKTILPLMAPVLSFTTEEAYQIYPFSEEESIFLTKFYDTKKFFINEEVDNFMEKLFTLRKELFIEMEKLREIDEIGSTLECAIELNKSEEFLKYLEKYPVDLEEFFIVSEIIFKDEISAGNESSSFKGLKFNVFKTLKEKCPRCWKRKKGDGELCKRCSLVFSL